MKNKFLTYALLLVVAIIWYQVFMRVKSNITSEDDELVNSNSAGSVNIASIKRDSFELKANYRDPFGSSPKTEISAIDPNIPIVKAPPRPKPELYWPKINYYGLVRNTESKNPLCIINIDGMLLYLRKGDEVYDGLRIKEITRDSILVTNKKHMKYFKRK